MNKFINIATVALLLAVTSVVNSEVAVLDRPDASLGNDHYIGNRPPLKPSPFIKVPVGSIEPRGWVRKQLELQAHGFHGRLGDISKFLQKQNNAWLNPEGRGTHGWEEVPSCLKG